MNINKVKNNIYSLKNTKLIIKKNLGRNKNEYYEGYIDKMYSNIFTIITNKGLISVSYSDIITKNVVISKFN